MEMSWDQVVATNFQYRVLIYRLVCFRLLRLLAMHDIYDNEWFCRHQGAASLEKVRVGHPINRLGRITRFHRRPSSIPLPASWALGEVSPVVTRRLFRHRYPGILGTIAFQASGSSEGPKSPKCTHFEKHWTPKKKSLKILNPSATDVLSIERFTVLHKLRSSFVGNRKDGENSDSERAVDSWAAAMDGHVFSICTLRATKEREPCR